MQVVIDIDEEDYKRIQDTSDVFNSLTSRTYSAIRNGTPLPKGHGRLIDADGAIQRLCDKSCGCTLKECGYEVPCFSVQRINSAQTIIEADNESEDKE